MQIKDTSHSYGIVTRSIHWFMALAIIAMFALGLWMRTLGYYDPYYVIAPHIHRSIGLLLLGLLILRMVWKLMNPRPVEPELTPFERIASVTVQWAFYVLLFALMIAGYFISAADGKPIAVFDWFYVPAVQGVKGWEKLAGVLHEYLAYAVIALAVLHAAAALKHHFVDKNAVLKRMISGTST